MVRIPLVCTNTSFANYDYGAPITANKSTDYRTSTGTYHRYIPTLPQAPIVRVKAHIKPELLQSEPTIRDITVKSLYGEDFVTKFPKKKVDMQGPSRFYSLKFVNTAQEKLFKNPPPPKELILSEMKDKYYRRFAHFDRREVFPPEPYNKCEIKSLGRDEQPPVPPEQKGYYKLLDPYVSTARATHTPFTKHQLDPVVRKLKGSGPLTNAWEPLVARKKVPMTDSMPFKLHPQGRIARDATKAVPNFGSKSTYADSYIKQTFSDMYPYTHDHGVECPELNQGSNVWQDLAPPGMYCTDYCHIGTGWPVNCLIDYGLPKKHVAHKPCYTKFCDWSQ